MINALEIAVMHTVEFREKYKPWLITPSVIEEVTDRWVFHHGFSKEGSSIVWYRPGLHAADRPENYIRAIVATLEFAVTASLMNSDGKNGRYNVVVDCDKFSLAAIPNIGHVKRLIIILQDHFPNRTGVIFIVNLASAAQLFLKMIRPLLTEVSVPRVQLFVLLSLLEGLAFIMFLLTLLRGTSLFCCTGGES